MLDGPTESPIVNEWIEERLRLDMRATLLRVLRLRFSCDPAPKDVLDVIFSQPCHARLMDWIIEAVGFNSIDEFRAFLHQ